MRITGRISAWLTHRSTEVREPDRPAHDGGLRRKLDEAGFGAEYNLGLLNIGRLRKTISKPAAVIEPRDLKETRPPAPSVPADSTGTPNLPDVAKLVSKHSSEPVKEALQKIEAILKEAQHLKALEPQDLRLMSIALVTACDPHTIEHPSALPALTKVARAFAAGRFQFEFDKEVTDVHRHEDLLAACALRCLAAAGARGVSAAAAAIDVSIADEFRDQDGHVDPKWFAQVAAAADKLDPDRTKSFSEIVDIAADTIKYTTPPDCYNSSEVKRLGRDVPILNGDHSLKRWASAETLLANRRHLNATVKEAPNKDQIKNRIPAIALLSLMRPRDPGEQPSEVERAAVNLMRNGLTDDSKGTPLSYANHRISKLGTYARRLKGKIFTRKWFADHFHHKNPLRVAVARGEVDRPESAFSSMRATKDSAQEMASIFGRLYEHVESLSPAEQEARSEGRSPEQQLIEENTLYHKVLLDHWAERHITTQQLDTQIERNEKRALQGKLETMLGTGGTTGNPSQRLRQRESGMLHSETFNRYVQMLRTQELNPEHLQKTGWDLVAYLGEAIRTVEAILPPSGDAELAAPSAADEPLIDAARLSPRQRVANDIVTLLAHHGKDKVALPGTRHEGAFPVASEEAMKAAGEALRGLETALLGVRTKEDAGPMHPERQRAMNAHAKDQPRFNTKQERRADPIGFLAHVVRDFELGSSLMLSNGHFCGVNLPLPPFTAWLPVTPVQALGRLGARHRREGVIKALLSSAGGEIFLGTARGWEAEALLGATGGAGIAGGLTVGLGGAIGAGGSATQEEGVYVRIPRNGEAGGEAGQHGDAVVASRMSEVLSAIKELTNGGTPEERQRQIDVIAMELHVLFPEVSISEVRGKDAQTEKHPITARMEGGVGLLTSLTAPATLRVMGLGAEVAYDRSSRQRKEQGGRINVSVRGSEYSASVTGGLRANVRGTGIDLASLKTPIVTRGSSKRTTLVKLDGSHSTSFRVEITTNLKQFLANAAKAMPGLVHSELILARRAKLTEENVDTRLPGVTRQDALQIERDEQAASLQKALDNIEPSTDAMYHVWSKVRPDAATALDYLDTVATLAGGSPLLKGVANECSKEYRRVADDPASFSPEDAYQSVARVWQLDVGTPVVADVGRRSTQRWTANRANAC